MAENTEETTNREEAVFSVVPVPEQLHQQVLDYIKQLEQEADTSAYMLRISGPTLAQTGMQTLAHSGCKWVYTANGDDMDIRCSD